MRATVRNGRLVLDEPTELPEGTVLTLVVDDESDDLSESEREALHSALRRSREDVAAGRVHSAAKVLRQLARGR